MSGKETLGELLLLQTQPCVHCGLVCKLCFATVMHCPTHKMPYGLFTLVYCKETVALLATHCQYTFLCSDLNLEFEIPFRELGFHGVPHRSTAFVMPTVNCLVELVEVPATVVAMPSVAIVNLERVGFNLRNFDMVIVFKVKLLW